ncbi:phospholipase D [Aspergillus alliaceus]|uniref:phospholipase D n=1 Tax=Petromyces alliaceus TaxID=209559 RepID=UPI0012A582FC
MAGSTVYPPAANIPEDSSDRLDSQDPEQLSLANRPNLSTPFPSTDAKRSPSDIWERKEAAVEEDQQEANTITDGTKDKPLSVEASGTWESWDGCLGAKPASLNVRRPNESLGNHQKALSQKSQVSHPGMSSRRPSVQFTGEAAENDPPAEFTRSRPPSVTGDDSDADLRGKQSIFGKLKAFAASPSFASHSRSASAATRKKKKKQLRRRTEDDSAPQTEPNTPKVSGRPSFHLPSSFAPFENYRTNFFPRRNNGDYAQHREGVSEDEGRDRLNRDNAWRRRSVWLANTRGFSYGGRQVDPQTNQDDRRPSNLRRFTGLAAPSENTESLGAPWKRHRAERGSSLSAQRWRQIKAGLKLIGQRRKVDNTVDHAKSAELLAELTSGVPAALILASMFQRDEHGSKRIPILLEQLKVRVTDSKIDSHSGDRHLVFRIELEYGSGMTRMKWIIYRTLRDFANLHLKYKLHFGTQKYIQLRNTEGAQNLPRFPRSAFPYLRGVRGLESDMEDEEDDGGYETAAEVTSGNERAAKKQQTRRRSSGNISRRQSSITNPDAENAAGATAEGGPTKKETYPERQRKKLESYLQKLIRFLIFKPDSNRLCKFLELSALGVRLAAEGSYHGKEGYLIIQSSKGLDFRRALTPAMVKNRHSPKWFLVRHSYVVCVDSPEAMNIYDVFLIDPFFKLQTQKMSLRNQKAKELAKSAKESARHPQHHTLRLENSERKLKLLARNERQLHQFEDSIRFMVNNTPWARPNRFDSFAPVRHHCFAQWLVDARDHMWMVSRAINQAKDVIYIHDWWLSPELYMRRPAAISQKWRLDRLLQRKAREGVKIFVIMYRNINSAIPIDSEYSKFSLLDLHPNIFVQRSPNQFRQNTFFWAHHEKLCIIDHTLAWDTPQHLLTDDKPTGFETSDGPKDADHCQLWPGKDYSNPRMYDRNVIPRMPWHDISMHVVGQPARDLTRHFRKPTRPTPFLLPPPDFDTADLEALGLDGTCEVQILRSSSACIMNAYVKLIEESDHFVYIENQFFVSTCEIDGRKIENLIGDALAWRAVIVIPLIPGFQNTVDSEGGTSVRLIMMCQYRSICRGETSIFGRLRALGIEPEDYIQFFSLRAWGKIGPQKQLVTEQLYIHAKCMIVDDRAAIIGSANINERSMLGSRDSEVAAVVRDTDMTWSTMNGRPYLVGRFPHTLRMHELMEHSMATEEELRRIQIAEEGSKSPGDRERPDPESLMLEKQDERDMIERRHHMHSFNHDVDWEQGNNPNLKVTANPEHKKDVDGLGPDHLSAALQAGLGDAQVLISPIASEGKGTVQQPRQTKKAPCILPDNASERDSVVEGLPAARHPVLLGHETESSGNDAFPTSKDKFDMSKYPHPLSPDMKHIFIDKDCMRDPVIDVFYLDTWHAVADKNTKLYRSVFRCMPDKYADYGERFAEMQNQHSAKAFRQANARQTGPPGTGASLTTGGLTTKSHLLAAAQNAEGPTMVEDLVQQEKRPSKDEKTGSRAVDVSSSGNLQNGQYDENGSSGEDHEKQLSDPPVSRRRRRRATTLGSKRELYASDEVMDKQRAEDLLNQVQGHLILWPYDWLEKEEQGGNWLYTLDQLSPLEI